MTAMYDFDAVLASALQADGPQATPPAAVELALESARSIGQRRPHLRAIDSRAWPPPVLSLANPVIGRATSVGLVLLLLLVAVTAFVVAGRLLERRVNVFGVFERTGDFPAVSGDPGATRQVDRAAVLADGRVLVRGMGSSGQPDDTWALVYDPAAGTWSETGRPPEDRQSSTATTLLDGRVLFVGGWRVETDRGPVLPSVGQLYDPATGAFQATRGGLATPRHGHTASLLLDGRVLIAGGSDASSMETRTGTVSAEIFDPVTGRFSQTGSMTESREMHAAARLADGRVLITGGVTSRDFLATPTADIFDPASETFTRVGPMRDARVGHAATALADGRVLIAGGSTRPDIVAPPNPLSSAELFDPATGSFAATGPLATERSGLGMLRLPDGRVLVMGGSNAFGSPRTAELFDPATGRFARAGTSATPHGQAWAGSLPDGRVLVLGQAQDATSGAPELWSALDHPTLALEHRDAAGPGFAPIDTETMPFRSGHTATLLADGRILLTGGMDAMAPNSEALASAEIFDPKTGRSRTVTDMSVGRSGHVAVPLADGRVLIAGGEARHCPGIGSCVSPQLSAEIFDPATRGFTTLPAKPGPVLPRSPEWPPKAAVLVDGRVLFIGGNRVATFVDPATGDIRQGPILRGDGLVSPVRLADGRVIILGVAGVGPHLSIFDVASQEAGTIPTSRDWDAAIALDDGRVLLVRNTGEAALFDPVSSTVTPTGSTAPRDDPDPWDRSQEPYRRGLALLSDGRVLVTGGGDTGIGLVPQADANLFDPSTGTFQAIGPMRDGRRGHSTTLLPDGRVVIIGGVVRSADRTDPEPVLVEIFDPSRLH